MKPVLVTVAAAADIDGAFNWYQNQRAGLGDEFRDALRSTLNQVQVNPRLFQVVHRGTRRALLRRFPYGVYFKEFPEVIIIVACMHGRREPIRGQSRR